MTKSDYKKHDILNQNLDRIVDDLIQMFEEAYGVKLLKSERDLFKAKSKSILYYWLGIVYDEASAEVKNLETALATSKTITKKLRDSQQNLEAIISSSIPPENKNLLTSLTLHKTYKVDHSDEENSFTKQVDSFYTSLQDKIIKEVSRDITPFPPKNRPKK